MEPATIAIALAALAALFVVLRIAAGLLRLALIAAVVVIAIAFVTGLGAGPGGP